jgi:hypothetical protein
MAESVIAKCDTRLDSAASDTPPLAVSYLED